MIGSIVNGIILGSIITLGAIGVNLIASILNFFNFAHGALFTVGAYLTLFFLAHIPDWGVFPSLSFGLSMLVAMGLSMILTSAIALLFDKVLFKPLRRRQATSLFLALTSLGMAFILRSGIGIIWGPDVKYYTSGIQMARKLPFGIRIRPDEIFIVGAALMLVTVVYLFLKNTKIGQAMRAMSDNVVLAKASGIEASKVITWTWIIATSLTALAGTLYGIEVQLRPTMGWSFLIPLFVAVIVGGIGSFWGAMAGGMIIGISEELITTLMQDMFIGLKLNVVMSAYKPAIAFVLVIIVLLLRPSGIFGRKVA